MYHLVSLTYFIHLCTMWLRFEYTQIQQRLISYSSLETTEARAVICSSRVMDTENILLHLYRHMLFSIDYRFLLLFFQWLPFHLVDLITSLFLYILVCYTHLTTKWYVPHDGSMHHVSPNSSFIKARCSHSFHSF